MTPVIRPRSERTNPSERQFAIYVAEIGRASCPSVTRRFYQGRAGAYDVWNVECSNDTPYAVMFHDAGAVGVVSCEKLKTISGVDCWLTFDDQEPKPIGALR